MIATEPFMATREDRRDSFVARRVDDLAAARPRDASEAAALLDDQALTEETFVMWDLIHDRSHMRGDLPFDPFMIKQRIASARDQALSQPLPMAFSACDCIRHVPSRRGAA